MDFFNITQKRYKIPCYIFVTTGMIIVTIYWISAIKPSELIEIKPIELNFTSLAALAPLRNNYKKKLFNIELNYILSTTPCDGDDLLAIIIVTSYFGNVEARSAMRRAFSSSDLKKLKLRRVFLLGEAPHDQFTSQKSVENEHSRFQDIIQGNFQEAYRNLTYKHIMGLKWASENCNKAQYIVKMDDDIVVNIPKMFEFIKRTKFPKKNLVAGKILKGMVPIRKTANKWYVTPEEYNHPTYPPFVSGWFYITTPQIASKFVLLSNYVKYFWIDDVYVTGILAQYLNIKHFSIGEFFTAHSEIMQCCIIDAKKFLDCDILIGPNGGDNEMFYEFNKVMEFCNQKTGCKKRNKPINETCVAEKKFNIGHGKGVIEKYPLG